MTKKLFLLSLLGLLLAVFSIQTAVAYNPDWKAEQAKMFEQMGLKPGDVIDRSNADKVKDFVPDRVYGWLKNGEFVLKVGEFGYDFSSEEGWDKASQANKGKYTLGDRKQVVDVASGVYPKHIYGFPFPNIDLKNDPDAGIKIMHNKKVGASRARSIDMLSETRWVGESGLERYFHLRWRGLFFWGQANGPIDNPSDTKSFELTQLLLPYDLTGTVILTDSPLNGQGDKQYVYVPSIRRVKKQSGAARSDPSFGSDFVSDDGNGFAGQAESMSWRVLGTKVALVPMTEWETQHTDRMTKQADGSWITQKNIPKILFGYNDPNAPKGIIPWCPSPNAVVWLPRKVVIVEAKPLDPYYNYGKQVFWFDADNGVAAYFKIIENKAGEHWKTVLINSDCEEWGDGGYKTFCTSNWHYVLDEKAHHCSIASSRGELIANYSDLVFGGAGVKTEYMRPEYIPLLSK